MIRNVDITRYEAGASLGSRADVVAVEEPLEICVEGQTVAVAMRTPGQDRELVAGWLLTEGIITGAADIADLVAQPGEDPARGSRVDALLRDPGKFDVTRHRRNVLTNASCGVCGAASVAQVLRAFPKIDTPFVLDPALLPLLPARLLEHQAVFQRTGGLHACALFDRAGQLLALREDVGRHNALDKLLGWALLAGRLPLSDALLFLSGRVSFEMVQKSLAARLPAIVAIGAPSSLAVELARASGQTLAAFLRGTAFNVYSSP
jgi:FdhD protein